MLTETELLKQQRERQPPLRFFNRRAAHDAPPVLINRSSSATEIRMCRNARIGVIKSRAINRLTEVAEIPPRYSQAAFSLRAPCLTEAGLAASAETQCCSIPFRFTGVIKLKCCANHQLTFPSCVCFSLIITLARKRLSTTEILRNKRLPTALRLAVVGTSYS